MQTLSLDFDAKTLARTADDFTSHQAIKDLITSGRHAAQLKLALSTLRQNPGRTSRELADIIGCDRYLFSRRLPDLLRLGLVEKIGRRICTSGKTMAATWVVKETKPE